MSNNEKNISNWWRSGDPWVWWSASAVSACLLMVFGLLGLIAFRGLIYFWPADVYEIQYKATQSAEVRTYLGEIFDQELVDVEIIRDSGVKLDTSEEKINRLLLKSGNKELTGEDFSWLLENFIQSKSKPEHVVAIERREWGNFYGYLKSVRQDNKEVAIGENAWPDLLKRIDRANDLFAQIRNIEKKQIGSINYDMERLRLRKRKLELQNRFDKPAQKHVQQQRQQLQQSYVLLEKRLVELRQQLNRDSAVFATADGKTTTLAIEKIVRIYKPNTMSIWHKSIHYIDKIREFVFDEPREANTEGGIFPAIFGTIVMVLIMTILVTPLGVIAALYLKEYATQGNLTRIIRIAVNNLAGVPSIVYGVFGLGFFIYFIGGHIDQVFFAQALPAPTFGTPGLLWASLTLALLTLPVVIVATEEGLTRIPRNIREASLALGATKAETLWRVVLPMASPALMTGLILAIARAAGEVAPLMLVGVVKLAPSMPLDTNFPYLHLERKIMHLGFHIYDVGFQSPNVEAARPLVYATAFLLVLVIAALNLSAIAVRNRLRDKYRSIEN